MEAFNTLLPAHNPPYIAAVRQFRQTMPGVPLVGSFETGFFQRMPPEAFLYALPTELLEQGVRKNGAHGASHEYVSGWVADAEGRDDLRLVSVHGRPADTLPGRVLPYPRTLLLTDYQSSPDRVAADLLAALRACDDRERITAICVRVAENLGLVDERLTTGSLEAISGRHFGPLNLVLVEQPARPEACRFGLGEDEIRHSRGLITKDEVRAAALHRLRLPATGVFWDIGGGSGSVSLEAARFCPELSVYTVERHPAEQANIRANIRTYGAYTIHLVDGEAPAALANLPDPDRVFIGGSGGQLEAILTAVVPRLRPGGRLVVSAVLARTETTARRVLAQLCRRVTSATLAVTRHEPGGPDRVLNPITFITGEP